VRELLWELFSEVIPMGFLHKPLGLLHKGFVS
jgi:hypothetical protein